MQHSIWCQQNIGLKLMGHPVFEPQFAFKFENVKTQIEIRNGTVERSPGDRLRLLGGPRHLALHPPRRLVQGERHRAQPAQGWVKQLPIVCPHCVSSPQSWYFVIFFDMFHWTLGWYCSYCAAQLVTGIRERKQNKTWWLRGLNTVYMAMVVHLVLEHA